MISIYDPRFNSISSETACRIRSLYDGVKILFSPGDKRSRVRFLRKLLFLITVSKITVFNGIRSN